MVSKETAFSASTKSAAIRPGFCVCIFAVKFVSMFTVSFLLFEVAALYGHVHHIIALSSKKKVFRIYAFAIIAPVTYEKIADFFINKYQICCTMRAHGLTIHKKSAVSIAPQRGAPFVAIGASCA